MKRIFVTRMIRGFVIGAVCAMLADSFAAALIGLTIIAVGVELTGTGAKH